ncbi:MAG: hypothetical protein R2758_06910 [Bacteroidales bacterium]
MEKKTAGPRKEFSGRKRTSGAEATGPRKEFKARKGAPAATTDLGRSLKEAKPPRNRRPNLSDSTNTLQTAAYAHAVRQMN